MGFLSESGTVGFPPEITYPYHCQIGGPSALPIGVETLISVKVLGGFLADQLKFNWKVSSPGWHIAGLKSLGALIVPGPGSAEVSLEVIDPYGCRTFCNRHFRGIASKSGAESAASTYPNPASEHITIVSESPIHSIEILSRLGHQVMTWDQSPGLVQVQMDLSVLPAGLYLAKIRSETGHNIQKFIKH